MKRILYVSAAMSLSVLALSFGTFTKVFDATYKIDGDSKLGKANCGVCHATAKGGKLNPYGVAMSKANGGSKKLDPAALKKIEDLDSDGDGMKNLAEIKADRNPGVKG
ncbi:MAG TPA: hypothetical protein VGE01_07640 [Fimbriimonas sp.]